MKKESFLLYKSFYGPIKALSREIKGELLDSIFDYQIDGTEPDPSSPIYIAFQFIKNQFALDEVKYQKIVERNRKNGEKGGRPKKETQKKGPPEEKPKETQKTESVITKPKKADNDNDNDNDKENSVNAEISDLVERLLKLFPESIQETAKLKQWVDVVDKLHRIDGLSFQEIENLVKFGRNDNFWRQNFLSIAKLRKNNPENIKYYIVFQEQLKLKTKYKGSKGSVHDTDY